LSESKPGIEIEEAEVNKPPETYEIKEKPKKKKEEISNIMGAFDGRKKQNFDSGINFGGLEQGDELVDAMKKRK